ncbi:MAG: TIGR02453 family protein [Myxococcales bacterium]|nr:TIGR02453 family protein [Myxococcales bacterium]
MQKITACFPDAVGFLKELEANNNREWFNANKKRYEREVREPAREFIRQFRPVLESISAYFEADDAKSGGSLMRIYRDTRFREDKTPYKTNIGIQFRHLGGKDVHAPGFYLHIDSQQLFVGVGAWRPASEALKLIRERIDEKPEEWLAIVNGDKLKPFERGGESLKRAPKGYSVDHPLIDEFNRTSHIAIAEADVSLAADSKLGDWVASHYRAASDYAAFLCAALGVDF